MKKMVMVALGVVGAMVGKAADHIGGTEISGDAIISGKTFSGTYEKSIYIIKGGRSVVFENCTFDGVSADADGSCVYVDRDDDDRFGAVTFVNCRFINCGNTCYDGGAIYIQNVKSTTQYVIFENCVAIGCKAENGGFMYINDNEAYVSGKDSTIITGCSAECGGGVYANRLDTFKGFILADNTAIEDGGGLYDVNTYGKGDVRECRFYRNSAGDEGGGLYVDDSDGSVTDCRFLENTADEDADFYIDDASTARENNLSTSDFARRPLKGDGTETNPIQIKDINDWDALCCAVKGGNTYENAFIMLTANIVVYNSVGFFSSDSAKKKPFMGTFDGNGRTITLYSLKSSNKTMFGCAVDATVRNLTVNGRVEGGDSLGAIFGNASGSTASNCVSCATIIGSGRSIGGIAGWAGNGSKFINCINNGEVVGSDYVGGIVGCEDGVVSVENCHSFGSVTCVRSNAGGITGNAGAESTHELCFYCKDHSPADSCGIGVSHDALWGDGSETAIELPEAMEEINGYIKANNKEKDGWLRMALNRDGMPIFVPNGITDEIGYKIQDISDSEYLFLKFRKLYSVKNNVVSNLNYRVLTSGTGQIGGDQWYVVEGTISRGKIDVNGLANLVLFGNSSLTVQGDLSEPGILVAEGNTLNIFGVESGSLTATGGGNGAGIGGGEHQSCGTVNIYGGSVTATGGYFSAGIGGGEYGDGGNVAIYGGSVTAYGGEVANDVAAGIGNGWKGNNGSLTLGPRVLEIDANRWKEGVTVAFDVPTNLRFDSVQVDGGKVKSTMKGKTYVCALEKGHSLTLKFVPQQFYVLEGSETVQIYKCEEDVILETLNLPTAKYVGVRISFAIPENLVVASVKVDNGALKRETKDGVCYCTLVCGNNLTVSFESTSFKYLIDGEAEVTFGPILKDTTIDASKLPKAKTNEHIAANYVLSDETSSSTNACPLYSMNRSMMMSDGWYVVTGEVTTAAITVNGNNVNLILADGAKLTVNGGIGVDENNTLTIYAQQGGSGKLVANGASDHAGIGGQNLKCGDIVINGGTVTATGGKYGAGIGGGYDGAGGNVTINGGTVVAMGGTAGAGIGGGSNRSGGKVTINGGIVTATGGAYGGAGIGGGSGGADAEVTLDETKVEVVEGAYGNGSGYVKIAEKGPKCEGGTIVKGEGGVWVVTPSAGVTAVTVAGLPDGDSVAVPPSVTKVSGVADGQIKVKSGAYDIQG